MFAPVADLPARVLALQRSAGNRAVNRLLSRWYMEDGSLGPGEYPPKGWKSIVVDGMTRWKPPAAPAPAAAAAAGPTCASTETHYDRWYKVAKKADRTPLPAGAPDPTDAHTEWRVDPAKVKFSQGSIDFVFSGKTPGGAGNVLDAIAKLKSGADKVDGGDALRVILTNKGSVVSLDNRRLYVAKRAKVGNLKVRWATFNEYKSEYDKFTSTGGDEGSQSIKVRNVPFNRRQEFPPSHLSS